MDEKLQKVLARAGLGSRREIERWIEQGRLRINQKTAKLGDRVSFDDRIFLDGKPLTQLRQSPRIRAIAYHKPVGEVCTRSDPEGRDTIFDHLPKLQNSRWVAVGRLDINTSGLLILTTDGELANRLMHPSREIEREYAVRVLGNANDDIFKQLQTGVELDDGMARFDRILDSGGQGINHWYHVTLKEGRNREVRRLWEAVGLKVSRLSRIRYANVELSRSLKSGKFRDLNSEELSVLYKLVDLPLPQQTAKPGKRTSAKRKRK